MAVHNATKTGYIKILFVWLMMSDVAIYQEQFILLSPHLGSEYSIGSSFTK